MPITNPWLLPRDATCTKVTDKLCRDADKTERLDSSEPPSDQQQVRQVVRQSEESRAAGLCAELFSGAAEVPQSQCEQTAPPAGRRLHLPAAQSPLPLHLLLPGPPQPLPMCTGELALEEHRGAGPAVDAQVSEARLVHQFLPHALRARRLEETLHPDCAGATTHPAAGATGNNSRHEDLAEAALLTEERPVSTVHPAGSSLRFGLSKDKQSTTLPPWRDSDRRPKDTLRFNYLDNLAPVQQALRGQMNITATTCRGNTSASVDGRRKSLSEATYKLRKAKSLMFLSSGCRPQHPPPPPPPPPPPHHQAKTQTRQGGVNHPIIKETTRSLLSLAQWNAGVRPGPVRSAVPRLSVEALRASQRSHRSSPSAPLFEVPSWIWPASQAR